MRPHLFFPKSGFDRIKSLSLEEGRKLAILAEMARHNVVAMIMVAGSGHLGASLSAADALTVLYHKVMRIAPESPRWKGRDLFIMSKGHGVPILYVILASCGFLRDEEMYRLRRLGGLPGHADMSIPGIEANTGSLGMGLSKGKAHALAARLLGTDQRVFVMVGDGELQEGQIWEAVQSAPSWGLGNLVLLVDQNMVQTDKLITDILEMPPIEDKLRAFGWLVSVIDGHDVEALLRTFSVLDYSNRQPKALILKTIKGRGVSFMEHPYVLEKTGGTFNWHDEIPNQEEFERAIYEIDHRITELLTHTGIGDDFLPTLPKSFERISVNWSVRSVVDGFSQALMDLAQKHKELVVLDCDLSDSCGLRPFERKYPERFIEVGIAEQDMVSIAGALAHAGLHPIVNTYAAFLTTRASEQIYNNQTEHAKVIYVGHLAGLIPGTPGKSHQAVRDIAIMRAMPDMILCEPCNVEESEAALRYLYEEVEESSYLRLANCKGLGEIKLPASYRFEIGKGTVLREGDDIAVISYGPIILPQVLGAAERLARQGVEALVISLPWFNHIDADWLEKTLLPITHWVCVENHTLVGGQADEIQRLASENPAFNGVHLQRTGLKDLPQCGQVYEVLAQHGLDAEGIFKEIQRGLN